MIFLFNLPLLFASNALYPLTEVPTWMQWLALINPATWYIEVSRSMGGDVQSTLTPFLGMGLLVGFAAAGTWLALRRFQQLTQRT
jgi:ABC-2 type transport system permease protein